MVDFATDNWAEIALFLLAVVRFAEIVVKATSTDKDDKIVAIVSGVARRLLGSR